MGQGSAHSLSKRRAPWGPAGQVFHGGGDPQGRPRPSLNCPARGPALPPQGADRGRGRSEHTAPRSVHTARLPPHPGGRFPPPGAPAHAAVGTGVAARPWLGVWLIPPALASLVIWTHWTLCSPSRHGLWGSQEGSDPKGCRSSEGEQPPRESQLGGRRAAPVGGQGQRRGTPERAAESRCDEEEVGGGGASGPAGRGFSKASRAR